MLREQLLNHKGAPICVTNNRIQATALWGPWGPAPGAAAPQVEAGMSLDPAVRDRFGVARRLDCQAQRQPNQSSAREVRKD